MTVTFPNTAVLYLRTFQNTLDKMKYVIITPGGKVQYDVPIMKVQSYSIEKIFEKQLLFLLPFYIFSHERKFPEYNSNEKKLSELKAEYQNNKNVQKGIGDMMRGALIETSARKLKNEGINEAKREAAIRMLKRGKLTMEEIAEYSGLGIEIVEQLAEKGTGGWQ